MQEPLLSDHAVDDEIEGSAGLTRDGNGDSVAIRNSGHAASSRRIAIAVPQFACTTMCAIVIPNLATITDFIWVPGCLLVIFGFPGYISLCAYKHSEGQNGGSYPSTPNKDRTRTLCEWLRQLQWVVCLLFYSVVEAMPAYRSIHAGREEGLHGKRYALVAGWLLVVLGILSSLLSGIGLIYELIEEPKFVTN